MKIQIKNKRSLNIQANKFLMSNCISRKNSEVKAARFTGDINGCHATNVNLIRKYGRWFVLGFDDQILTLGGELESFHLTRNSL